MVAFLKNLTRSDVFSMFSPQRQLLGLDIGSSGIKLVQLKETSRAVHLAKVWREGAGT